MITTVLYYCTNPACESHLRSGLLHLEGPITTNLTIDLGDCHACETAVAVVDPSLDTHLTLSLQGLT